MIAIVLFLALDATTAQAQLDRLREGLATRGKPATLDALEKLAAAAPDTDAGARALLWLGDLAREAGDRPRARAAFARVSNRDGELGRLAARGLGDVALLDGRYGEAQARYQRAHDGAPPLLAAELEQKITLTRRLQLRRAAAVGALALVVAALGWFVTRIRRHGPRLRFPTEVVYVLPIYALLIAGAWGLDRNIFHALILCALSSLIVIALSAFAAMRAPTAAWLHLTVLSLANAALFYAILWRTDLLDPLITTAAP
jgi:hypothetical protein